MSVASEFDVKDDKFQCLFTKMPIKPYIFYLWNANVIPFFFKKNSKAIFLGGLFFY